MMVLVVEGRLLDIQTSHRGARSHRMKLKKVAPVSGRNPLAPPKDLLFRNWGLQGALKDLLFGYLGARDPISSSTIP